MKKILFKLIRILGLPVFFREFIQNNKITILLFHDINPKTAKKTFKYLSKKYNFINLNDFIDALKNKDTTKIPKKALIITFDDGHIGNYDIFPVIKEYKVPVTIFLCAKIINTNRYFWFKYKKNLLLSKKLKKISNKNRLEILEKYNFKQNKEFNKPQALQKKQINHMKSYVNFQSHTSFHPILPKCNNKIARLEITDSKKILETEYNLEVNSIAYPNGDYSNRDIELSKKAGYKCGITVDYGFNTINSDPFRLKRISVNDTDDINELIVKASGFWSFLKTMNGRKQNYGFTSNNQE